jgi:ankyrin repeat protein
LEILVRVPGIDINIQNKAGDTPLLLAMQYQDDPEVGLGIVDVLLDSGADPR